MKIKECPNCFSEEISVVKTYEERVEIDLKSQKQLSVEKDDEPTMTYYKCRICNWNSGTI